MIQRIVIQIIHDTKDLMNEQELEMSSTTFIQTKLMTTFESDSMSIALKSRSNVNFKP